MALPSNIAGPVTVNFSPFSETFEPVAGSSDAFEKHAVATATLTWGTVSKQYTIDVREADYLAAADPVAFVEAAIHATMQQMFLDLSAEITPSVKP